ncbi:UNVERIFIED_CONTAM: hypothetical protein Sangu_2010600 [Sesamum angustifolium]|uniref:Rx N-terminal domain-containing protein n=1 Tax=Sesamum angustifolium TaxID=2727405 RepID=A0AAW2LHC4_9LAMI
MAVAAYASLLSLMHVLGNVQHPARLRRLHLDRDQIERLQKKVKFLKDFLEVHSQRKSNQEIEDLVRQIAVVSYEAEHIIDLHVVDQLREGSQDEGHRMAAISSFCLDIDKIIEEIDSITKELMMIQEGWNNIDVQKPIVLAPATSSKIPSSEKNSTMVGFNEHLIQIMDELAGDKYDLQILPVVGMGDPLDSTILENLQTLALIYNFRCMTKVLQRIPNLKKLKLSYPRDHVEEWSHYCLYNLARLHKLESLFLSAENFFLENIVFPTALKKLALSRCGIPWKDMEIIGSLLNLEVLKLYRNAFKGAEWNPVDGQFPRLSDSIVNSAKQILEEQHSNGNELQVWVNGEDVKLVDP